METSPVSQNPVHPQCHSNNNHDNRQEPGPNSVEEDYYDNCAGSEDPAAGGKARQTQKYRDGLESDNFVNKVARFEHLTHHLQNNGGGGESRENGRFPLFPQQQRRPNGLPKSVSSTQIMTDTIRRRPSPSFSRLGTSSEFRYFDDTTLGEGDGNCNHILQSSRAVPTIGYRRANSMTSTSSPYEAIPYVRSNTTEESSKSNAKPFCQNNESSQSCNSLSLLSQSSPSPDSVYSSHSSNSSFISYGNFRSTPVDTRNPAAARDPKEIPKFITYEELSDLRRKQVMTLLFWNLREGSGS